MAERLTPESILAKLEGLVVSASPAGVRFEEWTGSRSIPTLGTNAGALPLPFQSWRRFKESFAPELIQRAVRETGTVDHLVDPFGGSGTTALAAQFLGIRSSTIEVNPYLADLIEAKVASYDVKALVDSFVSVVSTVADGRDPDPMELLSAAPPTFVEPGVAERFLFRRPIAARLCAYRSAIACVRDAASMRLFRVLLGSVALPVSNALISGKGRRYRRGWQSYSPTVGELDQAFVSAFTAALFDIRRFRDRASTEYHLVRGDAREAISSLERMDLAIFSPPYPNSFDYTDVYNIELWILGYLAAQTDNRELREATLRSHVQIKRDYSAKGTRSPLLKDTIGRLEATRSKLWDRSIPEMIGAYFADMAGILNALFHKIRPGGRAYLVVGDSRYAGITVPVAQILCEEASAIGFSEINREAFRSMRSSPQQGGRAELPETLLTFARP